jgi:ligand-binding SRPBCC domain-containing protein
MTHHVRYEQWLPVAIEQVFLFFADPGNLPRIMPPGTGTELIRLKLVPPPAVATEPATITDREPLAGAGSEIVTSFRIIPFLPLRAQWTALITEFEWNHHFADVQTKGPFKSFHHRHELFPETRNGVNGTVVRDLIDYEVGFSLLGELAQRLFINRQLQRTFEYRQKALEKLLGWAPAMWGRVRDPSLHVPLQLPIYSARPPPPSHRPALPSLPASLQ